MQKNNLSNLFWLAWIIAVVVIVYSIQDSTKKSVECQITDKGIKYDGQQDRYMIYTDHGVFENTDDLLRQKFNSSDIYAKLKVGHRYKIRVVGFRSPFMSWYPNVLTAIEVKPDTIQTQ